MIRSYTDNDYEQLNALYMQGELYGGVFEEARDGRERLATKIAADPEAILVYEDKGRITGSISLIEDGRVAWLYRFVVESFDEQVTQQLYDAALSVLRKRGHSQVLVYSDGDSAKLDQRYTSLGMHRGGTYAAYWANL